MVHRPRPPLPRPVTRVVEGLSGKNDGPECLSRIKAHTSAADKGVTITAAERVSNDIVDVAAKAALTRFLADAWAFGK